MKLDITNMDYVGSRTINMRRLIPVVFLVLFTLLEFTQGVMEIQAQSIDGWSEPTNLSKSGSASNPILLVDSNGVFHVIWNDEFAGLKYVSGDGSEWTSPAAVDLPFDGASPELLADEDGYVHAFWQDNSNVLYYSSARTIDIGNSSAWTSPVQLAESALEIDIALDSNEDIHLSYVRILDTPEFPAGIYYRRLDKESSGWVWSSATLLYSSPYFRSLQKADANVDIAASTIDDVVQVFTAWDNRPRERVYLASSPDGGQTWNTPVEIDRPDSGLDFKSSANILIGAYDQDVLLVWQRIGTAGLCSQYYQQSSDGGETWSKPEQVVRESLGCGQDAELISDANGTIYLWNILQSQVNMLAWDRQQWSTPQVPNELSAFTDPETLKSVIYDCRQPAMVGSHHLAVVGCDTSSGGDIWFTYRELSDVSSWFSAQSNWSKAEEFVSSQFAINSQLLIAAPDNHLITLWSQEDQLQRGTGQKVIYFSNWNGENWSEAVPIMRGSQGDLEEPSAAIDPEGRLLAVWSASEDGKIYFSWANSTSAQNASEWADPVPLPIPHSLARAPKILISRSGAIYVLYVIPVNEGRGVYLTQSEDGGVSWSPPVRIFDGISANWEMVDDPQLEETPDGVLHALWSQHSLLDKGELLGLYYARSIDSGITWSDIQAITDGKVMWSHIASFGEGSLFRIWQEGNQLQPVIKYQFSQDSGLNWSAEESLGSFGEKSLMAKLNIVPAGNLHMLQIVQDSSGDLILRDWLWKNGRWAVNDYFYLNDVSLEEVYSMESTLSSDGILSMIFSAQTATKPGTSPQYGLFFTNRNLGLPLANEPIQTITPPPGSSLISPTESTAASVLNPPVVQPTSLPEHSVINSIGSPAPASSSFLGLGPGVFLSVLIVGVVVILGVWKVRSGR